MPWAWLRFAVLFFVLVSVPTLAQAPFKRNVLILSDVSVSHSLTNLITEEIVRGVKEVPDRHVEFYTESLDLEAFPGSPSRGEVRNWIAKKYGDHKLDLVVAIGPGTINFLLNDDRDMFRGVPIVISGSISAQVSNLKLDSRFTGTWVKLDPEKTLEAALRLLPDTRHVFVVGGSSAFDRELISLVKPTLSSFNTKAEIVYLTDMEMSRIREQLQQLPEHSIELYISFFEDSAGNKFLNATMALPMLASAFKGPTFGMSDTYMGHGIVGGYVLPFETQSKITARIVGELLDGKKAPEIPIETLANVYMFDWRELQHWHIPERSLPPGSVVKFREPDFWEHTKWGWISSLLVIAVLSAIAMYLQHGRKQLKLAQDRQMELSGLLIDAEEQERRRVASELHDDFSQRLAIVSLGLENVDEAMPGSFEDLHRQLHDLSKTTSELGTDLHTLSHRLHSSTLESLGLGPAVAAFCKEFAAQQGIRVDLLSDEIPRSVSPDVTLCIFRIAQEGLRNMKRYSGVNEAAVVLRMKGDRIEIRVQDQGAGFDLSELRQNEGLGIRSMEERARLLGGKFRIYSEPGKGTTLEAWVPLKPAARHVTS